MGFGEFKESLFLTKFHWPQACIGCGKMGTEMQDISTTKQSGTWQLDVRCKLCDSCISERRILRRNDPSLVLNIPAILLAVFLFYVVSSLLPGSMSNINVIIGIGALGIIASSIMIGGIANILFFDPTKYHLKTELDGLGRSYFVFRSTVYATLFRNLNPKANVGVHELPYSLSSNEILNITKRD